MVRRIVWSAPAQNDLKSLADYIKQRDPLEAERWVTTVLERASVLSELSERGRRVPELPGAQLRELVIDKNFRLVYRVKADVVEIVALLRAKQDFRRAWRRRSRS